jgi:hypothetical protein
MKTGLLGYSSGARGDQARQWQDDGEEAATADIVGGLTMVVALATGLQARQVVIGTERAGRVNRRIKCRAGLSLSSRQEGNAVKKETGMVPSVQTKKRRRRAGWSLAELVHKSCLLDEEVRT